MKDNTGNSNLPTYRVGGMAVVVGAMFFLFGLGLSIGLIYVGCFTESAPFWSRIVAIAATAFPLIFVLLGLMLLFSGQRVKFDPGSRRIIVGYGGYLTYKRESRSFDEIEYVETHRQVSARREGDEDGDGPTYPVRLIGPNLEIELHKGGDELKARRIAETVCKVIDCPLHDAVGDDVSIRDAAFLDESIADRARRLGETVSWPKLPSNSGFDIRSEMDQTVIEVPRPSKRVLKEGIAGLIFLVVLYGGAFGATAFYLRSWLDERIATGGHGWWHAVIYAVPLIPVLFILAGGVVFLIARERIVVSRQVLQRVWQFPVGRWVKQVPISAVEEITSDGDDVVIRTDQKKIRLGLALERKERDWLRKAVHYLLVNGPK